MSLVLAMLLASATPGAPVTVAPGNTTYPADCPPRFESNAKAPEYPPAERAQKIGGKTLLLLTLDRCGFVIDVQVETSAGNRNLDLAAIASAKTWRIPGDGEGAKVRVPVQWTPDDSVRHKRVRDAHFAQRRKQLIPRVAERPVPGHVVDPYPIGYATVAEARADVAATSEAIGAEPGAEWAKYQVIDEEGLSFWMFGNAFPAAARFRATGDGVRGLYVTSVLCEGSEDDCAAMQAWLKDREAQPDDMPPPPPAPG